MCHRVLSQVNEQPNISTEEPSSLYRRLARLVDQQYKSEDSPDAERMEKRILIHKMLLCTSPDGCSQAMSPTFVHYPASDRNRYRLLEVLMDFWSLYERLPDEDVFTQFMESTMEDYDLKHLQQRISRRLSSQKGGSPNRLIASIIDICYLYPKLVQDGMAKELGPSDLLDLGLDGHYLQRIRGKIALLDFGVARKLVALLERTLQLWTTTATHRFVTLPADSDFWERCFWASNAVFGSSTGFVVVRSVQSLELKNAFVDQFSQSVFLELLKRTDRYEELMHYALMTLVLFKKRNEIHYCFSPEFSVLLVVGGEIKHMIQCRTKAEAEIITEYGRFIALINAQTQHLRRYGYDYGEAWGLLKETINSHRAFLLDTGDETFDLVRTQLDNIIARVEKRTEL